MSPTEQLLMVLVTAVTNLLALPTLYVLYVQRQTFPLYVGGYTAFCSFMYHLSESLEIDTLYLDHVTWHRLDNIGSITSFVSLMVYFLDQRSGLQGDLPLQLLGLFLVLIMQAKDPWSLYNTFVPICVYLSGALFRHFFVHRARLNPVFLTRGLVFLAVGVFCFAKGLRKDYLRLWHGLWHTFGGFAVFYLFQAVDKDQGKIGFFEAVEALLREVI